MPTASATRAALRSLSPVSSTGVSPSARRSRIASPLDALTVSATAITPRAVPSQATTTAVAPPRSASSTARRSSSGSGTPCSARSAGRPTTIARPATAAATPSPARLANRSTGGSAPSSDSACAAIARATGCSLAASAAPASRSSSRSSAPKAVTPIDAQPPLGHRSRLVEHDRGHAARALEHLRPADEQAELGAAARADEECGRRREAEGARAGDDQHRHGRGEGRRGVAGREQPAGERRQ